MVESTTKRGIKTGWGLILGAVVVCVLLVGGSVLGGASRLKKAEAEARARGMYLTFADLPRQGNALTNGYLVAEPVWSATEPHQQTLREYDLMVELGNERYMRFRIDDTIQSLEPKARILSRAVRMETWVPDLPAVFDGAPILIDFTKEYEWLLLFCSKARRDYLAGDLDGCLESFETAQLWAEKAASTPDFWRISLSSSLRAKLDACIFNLAADYPADLELLQGLLDLCQRREPLDFRQVYSGLRDNRVILQKGIDEYRKTATPSSSFWMKYGPVNKAQVRAMLLEALVYQFDRTEELQTTGKTSLPAQFEPRGGTFIDRSYADLFQPRAIDDLYFDVTQERSRLVLAALAIMVEEAESGRRVNSLEEIEEDLDIRGLHYRRTDAGIHLWGNGADGVDDGGRYQKGSEGHEKDNVVQTMDPSVPLVVFVNWLSG